MTPPELELDPMDIDDNRVVVMHYQLSNGFGELIDSSSGALPLVYMHNTNAVLASLERELTGHRAGDSVDVTIYPEDAYGYADEELVQRFPRETLAGLGELSVGMRVRVRGKTEGGAGGGAEGESRLATVTELDEESAVLDGNHPLAGQVLHFSIAIVAVREPTEAELAAGEATSANPP